MMIAPIPGVHTTIPGSAVQPLPGIEIDIQDREGRSQDSGFLVITSSWPSQLRGIWGDPERYQKTYHGEIKSVYFSGDGARRDSEGNIWLMGRVDDVLNVSGHRLGTAEIESALVAHPCVAEAAVVGRPDEIKGEGEFVKGGLVEGHHHHHEDGQIEERQHKSQPCFAKPVHGTHPCRR